MHDFEIKPGLRKILERLKRKDKKNYLAVMKKIKDVVWAEDIDHFKNLKHDMKDRKRAHIGSFVLIFRYDKQKDLIFFLDYDHHDNIY